MKTTAHPMYRLLLCSLTIVAAAAACQFGPGPDCIYPCHCIDGAVCDSSTGDCPAGCDDGDPNGYMWRGAWGGPGCQVGNVAYNRSATGANFSNHSTPATRAVDGDRDPVYRATDGTCAYVRADHWLDLYWQVDLGSSYVIYNITVHSTDGTSIEHNYLTSRVAEVGDEQLEYTVCDTLGEDNNAIQVDMVCPRHLVGRYVRIRATKHDSSNTAPRMYLCEVFVIGYQFEDCSSDGTFGPGCLKDCHCRDQCDSISGLCSTQCKDGWMGDDCQQEVRLPPMTTHEDTEYHGVPSAQVTTPAPGRGGDSSSAVIASIALVLVLVIAAVALLFFLQRRGILARIYDGVVKRGGAEPPSTSSSGYDNPGFTNPTDITELCNEDVTVGSMEQLPESATVTMVRDDKADPQRDGHTSSPEWVSEEQLDIYPNEDPLGRPVKVQDLATYIGDMKSRGDAFEYEYMQIPRGKTAKWLTGATTVNKGKNRFHDIMAYDHSRVTLEVPLHDQGQGYINANFIPGYKDVERAYIASQGPRIHTVVDLWRMIWQYKVNRVVMVTKIMEEGRAKCEYYWPEFEENHEQEYGMFAVKLLNTENYVDCTIRTLSVTNDGETRQVTHFHFVGWPDHGVPLLAISLLEFRRKVRAHDDQASGPLLVHCSAGVGRTGTFIALDYLLDQAEAEGEVDVFKYTATMRNYRVDMIQNLGQYIFVYDALLQGLLSKDTRVPCGQMAEVFPRLQQTDPTTGLSPLEKQFQELEDLKPPKSDEDSQGLLPENEHKNRNHSIIPSEKNRPFLLPRVGGQTNYINAALVDGYRHQKSFIVTQMPLHETLGDFWQMLYDYKSASIVLLHDFDHSDPEDEMCPRYWPDAVGDVMEFDTLLVEMETEETIEDDIISRQFRITKSTEEGKSLVVSQLHLRGWPSDVDTPEDPDRLISLLEVLERGQQTSGDGTITVQCKTGAHQSGVLCAASYVLEKLKVDQEVDVFLAVAQTRLGRPQLIHSLEQYVFLHEIAIKYMDRNDTHANST